MNNKVKIAIVEDNHLVAEDISQSLQRCGYTVPSISNNGFDAIENIKKYDPDLALLDINLKGDIDGIEVARVINEKFSLPFIYLTAYADTKTFEEAKITKPNAYIVKPFNQTALHHAIELALVNYSNNGVDQEKESPLPQEHLIKGAIFIKEGSYFVKVPLEEIQYIEANGSYGKVVCPERVFTVASNLNKIHQKVSELEFVRVHRSYVVNLKHVSRINGDFIEIKDTRLPISSVHRKLLMERLRLV
jgi:DNA-binding LytR/AlgR family response regulator